MRGGDATRHMLNGSTARVLGDQVRFPGGAGIRGIGLLETSLPVRRASDDETDQDGATVNGVLTVEDASPRSVEAAVHRRGQHAVAKVCVVEAPLARLRTVQPERASF